MKNKVVALAVSMAFASTSAFADTSSMSTTTTGMGVLENDYVQAGVNGTSGTFGSGEKLRPIVGYTKGKTTVDGYTETGSVQSVRTVADSVDKYRFASVGFEFNLTPSISGSYVHDTDGTNSFALGLDKTVKGKTLTVEVGRVQTETESANTISAKLEILW